MSPDFNYVSLNVLHSSLSCQLIIPYYHNPLTKKMFMTMQCTFQNHVMLQYTNK